MSKKLERKIDELERRVRELETRPIVYQPIFFQPIPIPMPAPYVPPPIPHWQSPFTCGDTVPSSCGGRVIW